MNLLSHQLRKIMMISSFLRRLIKANATPNPINIANNVLKNEFEFSDIRFRNVV